MTDIVTRLRTTGDPWPQYADVPLCVEAADVIEQLRAAYDSRGGEMDSMRMVLAETQRWNDEKLVEIEQLRATINAQSSAIERADRLVLACEQHLRDAKHEIAKLRADLSEALSLH